MQNQRNEKVKTLDGTRNEKLPKGDMFLSQYSTGIYSYLTFVIYIWLFFGNSFYMNGFFDMG